MTVSLLFQLAAALSLMGWGYLLILRGRFWRCAERLEDVRLEQPVRAAGGWPAVAVVIPARDEAGVIGQALSSLFAQAYDGPLHIVLVDDHSTDGTAMLARAAAENRGGPQI